MDAQDHPRSRGVYNQGRPLRAEYPGSSPLARGLHASGEPVRKAVRIIPARAGFTWLAADVMVTDPDHPRSRGVYAVCAVAGFIAWGSSPLARGLPRPAGDRAVGPGIIPARAGFTADRSRVPAAARDHPRSRGVYAEELRARAGEGGSSPLARGLRRSSVGWSGRGGIIPARAGFTRPHSTT